MSHPLLHENWSLAKWRAPAAPDGTGNEPNHRVAFLARQEDFECLMLARFGMTTDTIASFTHLSRGQVSYRLKKAGIRIRDFRYGIGPYAEIVFKQTAHKAAQYMTWQLRRHIEAAETKQLNGS